jgi:hypothetical protein
VRRARALLGALLLLVAGVVALVPVGADAGTLAQAGWWWRVNDGSAPATVPPPATVPDGGLMVAGAPDGATAIAALHFDLGDGESSPVLTLQVAENGDQGGDTAILAACVTGSAWEPASAGTWTYKPFPACAQGSVNGVRSDDNASWTFALAPLVSDGIVDVTLVPGVDASRPDGANGSTFQLSFEAPSGASLATTSGGGPAPDFTVPEFGTPDASYGGATDFAAPTSGGELALPPVDPAASFTPALPEADQGLTATAPVVQGQNRPLATTPAAEVAEHRGLAALVLAICGAILLWSAQLPVPAPRRLGRFGTPDGGASIDDAPTEAAGLGRFARVRSGTAPRL